MKIQSLHETETVGPLNCMPNRFQGPVKLLYSINTKSILASLANFYITQRKTMRRSMSKGSKCPHIRKVCCPLTPLK